MTDYICAVGGTFRQGNRMGICGSIKCGSDDCGYQGDCEHQIPKCKCGGKFTVQSDDFDAWKECDMCGETL